MLLAGFQQQGRRGSVALGVAVRRWCFCNAIGDFGDFEDRRDTVLDALQLSGGLQKLQEVAQGGVGHMEDGRSAKIM